MNEGFKKLIAGSSGGFGGFIAAALYFTFLNIAFASNEKIGFTLTTESFIQYITYFGIFLLAAIVIGFALITMKSGEDKEKAISGFRGESNIYFANKYSELSKKIASHMPGFRKRFAKLRDFTGREPEVIFRNRLLFMRLLDQSTVFDTTYAKEQEMRAHTSTLQDASEKLGGNKNLEQVRRQLNQFRSNPGSIKFQNEDLDSPGTPATNFEYTGWYQMNLLLVEFVNKYIKWLDGKLEDAKASGDKVAFADGLDPEIDSFSKQIRVISSKINSSRNEYDKMVEYIPRFNSIISLTLLIKDQFNTSGLANHSYLFARRKAPLSTGGDVGDEEFVEVNHLGEYIEDINRSPRSPRTLQNPKQDTLQTPPGISMGAVSEYMHRDWLRLILDMRDGRDHPSSRNVKEYKDAWDKGIWKDVNMPGAPQGGNEDSPAFDLRVLKNPGLYSFAGRKEFNVENEDDNIRDDNHEPHISTSGINQFLENLIDRTIKTVKNTKDYLQRYPADKLDEPTLDKPGEQKGPVGKYTEKTSENDD